MVGGLAATGGSPHVPLAERALRRFRSLTVSGLLLRALPKLHSAAAARDTTLRVAQEKSPMLTHSLWTRMAIGAVLVGGFAVAPAQAQLNTQHIKGPSG